MSPRQVVVATHGHCFDGMASAAVFRALLAHVRHGDTLATKILSCGYGPNLSMVPEGWLDGDENAILDFRYTPSPKVSWYFDHHLTAFGSEEERAAAIAGVADARDRAPQVFHDATYGSCTRLLADVARDVYGMDTRALADLVRWAELIDTAGFASAEDAVRRDEPVLQLAAVVEQHGDRAFLEEAVRRLGEASVEEVARDPWVAGLFAPIAKQHEALMSRVKARSKRMGRVVVTDLTDAPMEISAKFVSYALFPECMYSVTLSRSKQHYKLAVGYNPWCGSPRLHNIASLCKGYGGGGHPVVGAATFKLADEGRARGAMSEVARRLDE